MDRQNFSYRSYAWQKLKRKKSALYALYLIVALGIVAMLAPFLANHHPLYAKIGDQTLFPAFSQTFTQKSTDTLFHENGTYTVILYNQIDWRTLQLDRVLWPPVAYSPQFSDKYNRDYVSPFDEQRYKNSAGEIAPIPFGRRHWMGTDKVGRDVASGIIHGSKTSLLVGLFSVLLAALIGVPLGAFAGYFGDHGIKLPRAQYWISILGSILGIFLGFVSRSFEIEQGFSESLVYGSLQVGLSILIVLLTSILFFWMGHFVSRGKFLGKAVDLPLDSWVSRVIEILNSLPTLILIITVAAIINERSMVMLVVIIGFTSWTGMARFMRAEMMKIKEMEYIQAAKVLGFSWKRIIFKHAIPNGLAPVFTAAAFGVASAILVESGLSFLGIGVPDDVVTWGKLLSSGKEEFEASWLVIFPGLAIFFTVTAYNLLGEGLRDALDPKMKS